MKKILYLMHIPWGWIKQRPHFLAEHLAEFYEVRVSYRIYKNPFQKRTFVDNCASAKLDFQQLAVLPFNRYSPIASLNARVISIQLLNSIRSSDIVWITHPEMFEAVEAALPPDARIVYDCMDNYPEFSLIRKNPARYRRMLESERRLAERSSLVIASSRNLRDVLTERYGFLKECVVLNNGVYLDDWQLQHPLRTDIDRFFRDAGFKLTYIGTINDWFDCDLIMEALERFPELSFSCFGPSEIKLPRHERFVHFGAVEHKFLHEIMSRSDALIMPFRVDQLILGVDPVKLYEYIFSARPTIASAYPELTKFEEYIHLYEDGKAFFSLLSEIMAGNAGIKRPPGEYRQFAAENTWSHCVASIRPLLDQL